MGKAVPWVPWVAQAIRETYSSQTVLHNLRRCAIAFRTGHQAGVAAGLGVLTIWTQDMRTHCKPHRLFDLRYLCRCTCILCSTCAGKEHLKAYRGPIILKWSLSYVNARLFCLHCHPNSCKSVANESAMRPYFVCSIAHSCSSL